MTEDERRLKLANAIEKTGERYVFHEANRVKKAPHRQPESASTDVARTVARYTKRNNLDLA